MTIVELAGAVPENVGNKLTSSMPEAENATPTSTCDTVRATVPGVVLLVDELLELEDEPELEDELEPPLDVVEQELS